MKVQRFEDLIAWQKAQYFAVQIYKVFGELKDWDFRNQIRRAAVSISNNIAEGFNRRSTVEFRRFLDISQGSCSEVRSMLYLAEQLNYLNENSKTELLNLSNEISRILTGLTKALKIPT